VLIPDVVHSVRTK